MKIVPLNPTEVCVYAKGFGVVIEGLNMNITEQTTRYSETIQKKLIKNGDLRGAQVKVFWSA
jgi:hypothetical protein